MKKRTELTSCGLHILAMALMLCDHLWATLLTGQEWLTCIGRIAFPIFAFLIAEGITHTSDIRRYIRRLLVLAVLSEIPFNLMYGASIWYPYHQNVIWTFLIAVVLIQMIRRAESTGRRGLTAAAWVGAVVLGAVLGMVTMVDYYAVGVLTVLVFYGFRERKWWCLAGQFICLYWMNVELLGGYFYPVELFGHTFELVQQGLALLALIPIWLYRGRQGYHAKWFQYTCYAFYPVHMLVLYIAYRVAMGI